jgi:uncharacterized protein YukE
MVADARRDLDLLGRRVSERVEEATSAWSGRGGAAFQAVGRAWHERQREIVGALEGFEASLRATERDNVRTDDTQSAAYQRQHALLG